MTDIPPSDPKPVAQSSAASAPLAATANEASLAGILIGGAFGLIAAAVFAISSFLDKVEGTALIVGFCFAVAAIIALGVSIFAGGRGISRPHVPGPRHPFNVQAGAGLIAIILLCVSAAVFLLNPKDQTGVLETRVKASEDRLLRIETTLARTNDTNPVHSRNSPPQKTAASPRPRRAPHHR